jgi:outer membrane protein assembly factor BamB
MQNANAQRNGYQGNVGLSSATVGSLKLAWKDTLDTPIQASPIVAGNVVYVATFGGAVVALDAATGAQRWVTQTGSFVRGTPSIDGNTLIVPLYNPSGVVALNATTGQVLWIQPASAWGSSGEVRTEPLIVNGLVYAGTAGGDADDGCNAGTVIALSELTGAINWTWHAAGAGQGVGVWSPISLAPNGDVVVGTGNACGTGLQYVESAIALNPTSGTFHWQGMSSQNGPDVDIGGGIAESGTRGFFSGKDGNLYGIDVTSGAPLWHVSLGSVPGFGSIATPATDGSNVVTQSGALLDPNKNAVPTSVLYNYGTDGTLRWKSELFQNEQFSSPVITSDVVVANVDQTLQVRSLQSGSLLWSYALGSFIYASPAVLPSGIYTASYGSSAAGGVVAAFKVGAGTASVSRSLHVSSRPLRQDFHPWRGR